MSGLIFFITFLAVIILTFITVIAALRHKPVRQKLIIISIIASSYGAIWFLCYIKAGYTIVPVGTDICFDDWCATVSGTDFQDGGRTIVLHVNMANHARGTAQKPDEPRFHLIDDSGNYYTAIKTGVVPLDSRLNLNESLQTTITFSVPQTAKGLKALIEEGPFIAYFVFPADQQVFVIR